MAATTVHRARVVAAKVAVVGAETAGAGAKEATVVEAMVEAKARLVVMVATMAVGWAAEEAALATRVEQMVVLRAVAELAAVVGPLRPSLLQWADRLSCADLLG